MATFTIDSVNNIGSGPSRAYSTVVRLDPFSGISELRGGMVPIENILPAASLARKGETK